MPDVPDHALLPLPVAADAERLAREWFAARVGRAAEAVPVRRDAHGRPRLAAPLDGLDLGWSHSGGWLLLAGGEGLRLGCDLEHVRPRPNARALAQRFFHADEAAWLDRLPQEQAERTFLRLWCAKEALLKAYGRGLAFGLQRLRLIEGAHGLELADCDPRLGCAGNWQLHEWSPRPGFHAALAWHRLPAPQAAILPP
ncbi:4'-phosphopantetheinyl transferase family protein [Luteimonas sp. e5]